MFNDLTRDNGYSIPWYLSLHTLNTVTWKTGNKCRTMAARRMKRIAKEIGHNPPVVGNRVLTIQCSDRVQFTQEIVFLGSDPLECPLSRV